MKKLLAILFALLLTVCALTACGEQPAENNNSDAQDTAADVQASSVDLGSLLDSINTQYGLEGLRVLDKASDLNRYYAVEETDVKQFAAELTSSASEYNEVIIIEAVSSDAAQRINTQLNSRLDSQLNTANSYNKDSAAMIEQCEVKQTGNYVYLVISENAGDVNSTIAAAVG